MQRFIAFLRAINVGGRTVKMSELCARFEALGFGGVASFIASGNIVFESADADARALEARIERELLATLGYEVATFVRTPAEVAAIARYEPFPHAAPRPDGATLYVGFLREPPSPEAAAALLALRTEVDEFHVHGREFYRLCRVRMSESPLTGAQLERALGMPATVRNVNTIQRLAAKYPS
ncbi:MAG: DUF1697 domain-containing protein [Gemmatimonadetes bacterium]|nr:DUF1697 domain-containing protein [Gemmatimonadota bacterium]